MEFTSTQGHSDGDVDEGLTSAQTPVVISPREEDSLLIGLEGILLAYRRLGEGTAPATIETELPWSQRLQLTARGRGLQKKPKLAGAIWAIPLDEGESEEASRHHPAHRQKKDRQARCEYRSVPVFYLRLGARPVGGICFGQAE